MDTFVDQSKVLISKLGFDPGLTLRTLKKNSQSVNRTKKRRKQYVLVKHTPIIFFYSEIDLVFL